MSYPYTITNSSLSLIVGGKTYTLRDSDTNFKPALTAILSQDWSTAVDLVKPAGMAIEKWLRGAFQFRENHLYFNDEPLDARLNTRLLKMAADGESPEPWLNFWSRLQNNPSNRSVTQLYAFLEHNGIAIDAEGYILAYKSLTQDFKDHHTRTIDNTVGSEHTMPRNKISDDPNHACHYGFHVGALRYASSFGSDRRIVICRVDPADVVCVPYDSNAEKVRVCAYSVIGHYSGSPLPDTVYHEDYGDVEGDDEDVDVDDEEGVEEEDDQPVRPESLDYTNLESYSLAVLRSHAAVDLKIVGASKIPGGKFALIKRILEVKGT